MMISYCGFRAAFAAMILTTTLLTGISESVLADPVALSVTGMLTSSNVNGVQVGAGNYTAQQLTAAGAAVGTVSAGGLTGVPIWSLLGGSTNGMSDVVTATPAGDNGKNAILRSYVVATSVTGAESIISLGEIDPFFGGTGSVRDFIAFSGTDGKPELVFPGTNASGRNVVDIASLQVLAAPALTLRAGSTSSSLALSGSVSLPGNYTLANLKAFPATTEIVGGDTYTGVSLWTLLNTNSGNIFNGYVLAGGTDGYEVLFALAELDPALGAPGDLVPYADNKGQFPADGFARIVIPGDNHAGRYVSNVDFLEVVAVPEPSPVVLLAIPLIALFVIKIPCVREAKQSG